MLHNLFKICLSLYIATVAQDTNWVNLIKPNLAGLVIYPTNLSNNYSVLGDTAIRLGGTNSYIVTEKSYNHYVTKMEYRFEAGGGNTGFLYHVNQNAVWPRGLELQWMSGDAGSIWTTNANIVTTTYASDTSKNDPRYLSKDSGGIVDSVGGLEGRAHGIKAAGITEKTTGQWNSFELRVHDDSMTTILNGKVTFKGWRLKIKDGNNARWTPLTSGRFGPQAEGPYIHLRNWKMVDLSGTTHINNVHSKANSFIKWSKKSLLLSADMHGIPTILHVYNSQGKSLNKIFWIAGSSTPMEVQKLENSKASLIVHWHNRLGQGIVK